MGISFTEADLAMKEKVLARLEAPDTKLRRFRAPDSLMRFLQALGLCIEFAGPSRFQPWGLASFVVRQLFLVEIYA
ncbi:hypothetical protein LP414_16395 [Polaromonas sp. P1(28)-13]|nr:hypothetical protein LP417_13645 [Polaromonas sp. P1-6]UUZ78216.1 hypothetical protein LP414_16395 [Polaromonas sp. P1(28)-13]